MKADPAPDVEILDFNLAGPVLAVRPYCHTDHYWQVYFDTNRAIRESFGAAGFPVPEQHVVLRNGIAAGVTEAFQDPRTQTVIRRGETVA